MKNSHFLLFIFSFFFFGCEGKNAMEYQIDENYSDIYQWAVDLESIPGNESENQLRAFMWIPPECSLVKGIVLACHNLQEEGILTDKNFRKEMAGLDFAIIWITPGWNPVFDVKKGAQIAFAETVKKLAEVSGYTEINYAPVVYMGHSAHASGPYNFGAWNPDRILAMLSIHGDSPLSDFLCCNLANPDWGERNIDGIPGLICIGEHEWLEERLRTAFPFMKKYPKSTISLLCDAGHWHNDISDANINYLTAFIKKAVQYRMPSDWNGKNPVKLKKLNPKKGWLADRWRSEQLPTAEAASYEQYTGNKDSAFWYFDEEMACMTEEYYARERGKRHQYINIKQQGEFIDINREMIEYKPETDGLTFGLNLCFTDSAGKTETDEHSENPIVIKRVTGPVKIINDSTYKIQFYRMGTAGRKTGDIDMIAYADPDSIYRRAWRRVALKIPGRLHEGDFQEITFPEIPDVKIGMKSVELKATSTSGLPVYYYIKGGPAVVEGNKLLFSAIPPRAKYPMKVTVVAWQYGSINEPKIQTAEPVERVFYIKQ